MATEAEQLECALVDSWTVVDDFLSSIDPGVAVEASEHVDERCRSDIPIKYVPSPGEPFADVAYWTARVVGVSLSPIDPGAAVEADLQLESANVRYPTRVRGSGPDVQILSCPIRGILPCA